MIGVDRFAVPAGRHSVEQSIKRSRFIATVDYVADRGAFEQLLADQRQRYPDAGHHCWAYVAGQPGDLRMADKSDDGEPRGTAGRPMLTVLEHADLGFVGAVVTRYFGGTKLGAGGLVRAYGGSVGAALDTLPTRPYFVTSAHVVRMPYSRLASVEHWLAETDIEVTDKTFVDHVELYLNVPLSQVEETRSALALLGHGDVIWTSDDAAT